MMLDVLQFLLASYLAFTSFCRLRKTDTTTVPAVRHAFALQGAIAVTLGMLALVNLLITPPAASAMASHPATVLALIGIAVVQAVTAMYWRQHVPDQFVIHAEEPKRRASDHRQGAH